jgi:hypothetical protein
MRFALGIIAVGFVAVPMRTAGAAYDLRQTVGWKHGLSARCRRAPRCHRRRRRGARDRMAGVSAPVLAGSGESGARTSLLA